MHHDHHCGGSENWDGWNVVVDDHGACVVGHNDTDVVDHQHSEIESGE